MPQDRPSSRSAAPARHGRRRPSVAVAPEGPGNGLDAAIEAAQRRPVPPVRPFAAMGLPDGAVRALKREGLLTPFSIQAGVLPDALAGRDILAKAQTGSGKTLAFGLPALARLHSGRPARPGRPRALVIVPTRELARQVGDALSPIANALDLRVASVFGGAPMGRQIDNLRRGVDLLVATPGRLIDLMERGSAVLDDIEITVLDEADQLADMGFTPDVTKIWDATPPGAQRMLFSATLDRQVAALVERYLAEPVVHATPPAEADEPVLMTHQVFRIVESTKVEIAAVIAARPARTLFFVRTRRGADQLAEELGRRGVAAGAIHGDLRQKQRLAVLDGFASGATRVMVATDVAARGLHIPDVDLVVHYDPANDHKDYLHRSGRTARAGAAGTVVSLMTPGQNRLVARLHSGAAVIAEQFSVTVDHPIVQALAASGTPIEVPPAPAPKTRSGESRRDRDRPAGGRSERRSTDRRAPERQGFERPARRATGTDERPARRAFNPDERPARRTFATDERPARRPVATDSRPVRSGTKLVEARRGSAPAARPEGRVMTERKPRTKRSA